LLFLALCGGLRGDCKGHDKGQQNGNIKPFNHDALRASRWFNVSTRRLAKNKPSYTTISADNRTQKVSGISPAPVGETAWFRYPGMCRAGMAENNSDVAWCWRGGRRL